MKYLPRSVKELINEFQKLPGVGPKTAERFVFHLLKKDNSELKKYGDRISKLKEGITECKICGNIAENNPCEICQDSSRDKKTIAVVEKSLDVVALEKTGQFRGVYHILKGILSPIEGVTAQSLNIKSLLERVKEKGVSELILAISPSLEGEATTVYLEKIIRKENPRIKITRIARGIPVGGDLEYADEVTLIRALEGRREY